MPVKFRPGDTVEIVVAATDASGATVSLSSIVATITLPSGATVELSYPPNFTPVGSKYVASYTIPPNEEGTVKIDIVATDSLGNKKREIYYIIVDAD